MFKKIILSTMLIGASFIISCTQERFENFGNAIKGLIPEECDECFIVYIWGEDDDWLENYEFSFITDGDYLEDASKYWSSFRMSYSQPGDEFYARIDWEREPLSTPGEGMRYAIIKEGIYNQIKEEDILYLLNAKLKPSKVYEWDFNTNELRETGESTDKIESRPDAPSGSGGSSGGGGVDCDPANYNGPEFNIQVDSQCKLAYLYDCQGNIQGRDAACSVYYDYGESVWTGSGSLPKCPYCN